MNIFEDKIVKYFKENYKMTKLSISLLIKRFKNEIDNNVLKYLDKILENTPEYENVKNIIFSYYF